MNGFSLIFAVLTILAVAFVAGAVILLMFGGLHVLAEPPWRKRHGSHLPHARG